MLTDSVYVGSTALIDYKNECRLYCKSTISMLTDSVYVGSTTDAYWAL